MQRKKFMIRIKRNIYIWPAIKHIFFFIEFKMFCAQYDMKKTFYKEVKQNEGTYNVSAVTLFISLFVPQTIVYLLKKRIIRSLIFALCKVYFMSNSVKRRL